MRKLISPVVFSLIVVFIAAPSAQAFFHLYNIRELSSNADGTVQFVELFTTDTGQFFLKDHTLIASQGASSNTFTFLENGPYPTANRPLLLATPGFEAECGIVPDFILEPGFLFEPSGIVDFGTAADVVSYASLPVDGTTSLNYPGGVLDANSPENYAGDSCSLGAPSVPGPGALLLFALPTTAVAMISRR